MASLTNPRIDLTISRLADERNTSNVVNISVCILGEIVSEGWD